MKGFTLIELLIVIGLFSILSTFVVINLIRPQTKASVDSSLNTLVADLKQEQIKSMAGDSEGLDSAQTFGIYFGGTSYTIFRGSSYFPSDTSNFEVKLDTNLTLSSTFPGSQVVFNRRSGEVNGFVNGSNTVTITNTADGEAKTISINQLGVISGN